MQRVFQHFSCTSLLARKPEASTSTAEVTRVTELLHKSSKNDAESTNTLIERTQKRMLSSLPAGKRLASKQMLFSPIAKSSLRRLSDPSITTQFKAGKVLGAGEVGQDADSERANVGPKDCARRRLSLPCFKPYSLSLQNDFPARFMTSANALLAAPRASICNQVTHTTAIYTGKFKALANFDALHMVLQRSGDFTDSHITKKTGTSSLEPEGLRKLDFNPQERELLEASMKRVRFGPQRAPRGAKKLQSSQE